MWNFRRRILSPAKSALREAIMGTADFVDTVLNRRPPLSPPRRLAWSIGGNFDEAGKAHLNYFKNLAHLKPTDRILDVGCGVGRMAVPLTSFLAPSGSYEGFDIMKNVVDWCSQNITPRFPNFRFQWVQVYNKEYNPTATLRADSFKFPYPEASFDFVFATSVFTHMFEKDVANYMREIHRVLKPGGRCLLSWFVLTPESLEKMKEGKAALNFAYPVQGAFTSRPEIPEAAIAFTEDIVEQLYAQASFDSPVRHLGHWSSVHDVEHYQDILLAEKRR